MKTILFVVLAAFVFNACRISHEESEPREVTAEAALDPIVMKAKDTSLYTDRVDWKKINEEFIALRKENSGDLIKALQFLINSLGDEHASIRSAKDFSGLVFYTGERKLEDTRDSTFVNEVINDTTLQFGFELLDNQIGYLKVVGIGAGSVKAQADAIRKGLIELKKKEVTRWILDLRFNGGGNMEPMLSGLAPLIGEGFIGGAANLRNETTREYHIKQGQFFNSGRLACEMPNEPIIPPEEKVAVLLSRYTASSGELVAVAFKGRAHTRFIGEETAGYTTGNGFEAINDELFLLISQDIFMDRAGRSYPVRVGVDEPIEFQPRAERQDDLQISRAVEWLLL